MNVRIDPLTTEGKFDNERYENDDYESLRYVVLQYIKAEGFAEVAGNYNIRLLDLEWLAIVK